jgi:hypothetical protein
MIFAAALVALHVAVFAWGAIDDSAAAAALPLVECALALIGLAIPGVRRGMLDALIRYWPAALAFALLAAVAIHDVDAPPSTQLAERFTRSEAWRLIGFAMAALCAAGAALSAGRRKVRDAVLIGAIALGALVIIQHMQSSRAPSAGPEGNAAMFALLSVFSVYGAIEALGRRATRPMARRTTRAERLFLPTAALLSALIGVALTGLAATIVALSFALAALTGALALRERRRGAGLVLLCAAAIASLGAGAGLVYVRDRGEDLMRAPHISVSLGFSAAALAWTAFLAILAASRDRRRRPSRGLSLALGGGAILAFAGGGAAFPAFPALALLIGLAGAQADGLARVSPESRSSDQP